MCLFHAPEFIETPIFLAADLLRTAAAGVS
jgi:hypothetical protein